MGESPLVKPGMKPSGRIKPRASFVNSKTFDILAASPLIVWYGFAIAGIIIKNAPTLSHQYKAMDWGMALDLVAQLATMAFLGLQVVLFLVRHLPIEKAPGVLARATGLVGANLPFAFLLTSRVPLSIGWSVASTTATIVGTVTAVWVAFHLGRAFSISPQARKLVMIGPYRVIRHPLYLAEFVAMLGIMLQHAQPLSGLIALACTAAQFARMHYEEIVLRSAFTSYGAYAAKTKRIIPLLY